MIKKYIASPVLMLVLIVVYCIAMAIATFVENSFGAEVSRVFVYHNLWFILLHILMLINGFAIIRKRGLFSLSKLGPLLFHISFFVILVGATTTHVFSREGIMHIREGEASELIYLNNNESETIPVQVFLNNFILKKYTGSNSPSSYESHVTVNYKGETSSHIIKMNQVLNVAGYRFFQTSYDKDEMGTVLTVNYDVPGMHITYLGYLLLLLGFVITPFQKNSRFRILNKRFKSVTTALVFLSFSVSGISKDYKPISVPKEAAREFGTLLIQNPKGRLEPVNTWSSKILRKIHQSDDYAGFTADQIFLNLFLFPDHWDDEPLIKIKNKDVKEHLGIYKEYASYNDFFSSNGHYVLQKVVGESYETAPSERSKFHKDILVIDEVVNIIFQIQQGGLMQIFPNPLSAEDPWVSPGDDISNIGGQDSLFLSKIMLWYSESVQNAMTTGKWEEPTKIVNMIRKYQEVMNTSHPVDTKRIEAELKYNRLNIFGMLFKVYLLLGVSLLILSFYQLFKKDSRVIRYLKLFLGVGILSAMIYHSYGFILRWYVSGYAPWSNSYETMIFVSWSVVLIGLLFVRKSTLITGLTSVLAGVLMFVSSLNWMSPEITPLVPVLQSYWLMLHVAIIMMGYGFFFVSALIGLTNMILSGFISSNNKDYLLNSIQKSTIINEMSLIMGTIFMCLGIFIGAVWANESWGRYWGWDPKETWALITMMVYTLVLHMRFVPRLNDMLLFNIFSLWAILSVLMTYFGVNYYLSGLHSYGNSGGNISSWPIAVGLLLIGLLTVWSLKGRKYSQASV